LAFIVSKAAFWGGQFSRFVPRARNNRAAAIDACTEVKTVITSV